MKVLINEFKINNKIESSIFLFIFLFSRYIPIMILLNDWMIHPNQGFYFIFGKFTLANLFKKLQNIEIINILFTTILLTIILFLIIIFYLFLKIKDENKQRYTKIILIIIQCLFYVFYCFPNFIHEIIYINIVSKASCLVEIDNYSNSDKKNIINDNFNSARKYDLNFLNFAISMFFMIIALYLNYKFEYYLPNINSININQINSDSMTRLNYMTILLPTLHAIIVYEVFMPYSRILLLILFLFRIIYIFNGLIKTKNFIFLENEIETFLIYFGIILSLTDFIFISDFLSILKNEDYSLSFTHPESFSLIYSHKYQIIKIIFALCFCIILLNYKRYLEINYISKFFLNSNGNNFFKFYCKFFKFLKNFDNYSKNQKILFLSLLHKNINEHHQKCKLEFCSCKLAKGIFDNFIQGDKIDYKQMKILLIDFLEMNIIEINQKIKNNETKTNLENILTEVYFFYYFKGYHNRCILDLEKILSINIVKKSKLLSQRIILFKLEIINSFKMSYTYNEILKYKKNIESENKIY